MEKELIVFNIKVKDGLKTLHLVERDTLKWYNLLFRSIGKGKQMLYGGLQESDKRFKRMQPVIAKFNDDGIIVDVKLKSKQTIDFTDVETIKLGIEGEVVKEEPSVDENGNDSGSSDNKNVEVK